MQIFRDKTFTSDLRLRLTDDQLKYLKTMSKKYKISMSKFVRVLIDEQLRAASSERPLPNGITSTRIAEIAKAKG